MAYHDANVFLLCFKASDPISLYNVKNKWIVEIRKYRPDAPVVLCGCQVDLRSDPSTIAHLSKTGRTPVSPEQALAICCEIEAVHYVEASARRPNAGQSGKDNSEAFELCALAAMKHKNETTNNNNNFRRVPSINSTISLFESNVEFFNNNNNNHCVSNGSGLGGFRRSPSTNSNLSLAANFKMPTMAFRKTSTASVTSLKSPTEEVRSLRTFSPEPISTASGNVRIPPVISEHETYQATTTSQCNGNNVNIQNNKQRPSSLCEPFYPFPSAADNNKKLQRPTTLFGDVRSRNFGPPPPPSAVARGTVVYSPDKFFPCSTTTSGSEFAGTPCSTVSFASFCSAASNNYVIKSPQFFDGAVSPANAQVRPNCLSRRTSYRTHPKMAIPVATPMSPVGSEISFDCSGSIKSPIERSSCQSPTSPIPQSFIQSTAQSPAGIVAGTSSSSAATAGQIPVFEPKIYESLKSSCSSSGSSDGSSKLPSDLSDSSSISYKDRIIIGTGQQQEELIPDTEDPSVLGSLNFVSPKAGVYRPAASGNKRTKHNCIVM